MLLDIAVGLFLATGAGWVLTVEQKIFFLLFGVVSSLVCQDIDALVYVLLRGRIENRTIYKHRKILHYPLIFVFVTPAFYFWLGFSWALVWFLGNLWHFIHDTIDDDGWGIRWLYPFWDRYVIFTKYSKKRIFSKEEREKLAEEFGDPDWLNNVTSFEENVGSVIALIFAVVVSVIWLFD